jgi:hypothetical protein
MTGVPLDVGAWSAQFGFAYWTSVCWRGIEIDAPNLRLAGQEGNTRRLIGTPWTIDQLKLSHLK